jgi:hypothetical protein
MHVTVAMSSDYVTNVSGTRMFRSDCAFSIIIHLEIACLTEGMILHQKFWTTSPIVAL